MNNRVALVGGHLSVWIVLIGAFFMAPIAQSRTANMKTNQVMVIEGKATTASGGEITGSAVITVQIKSPEPSLCLLWSETQTVEILNGEFKMEIGYSSNRVAGAGGGSATDFNNVFVNSSTVVHSSASCASGSTYTPSAADDRLLFANVNYGGENISLAAVPLKSVPFAMQAESVGGYSAQNLAKISGAGSSVVLSPDEFQSLKDLLGGDILWDLKSRRLTNVAAPSAGSDAVNKTWVEAAIAAASGGTVTSVQLSAPASVFSVAGSPVTSSGNLGLSFVSQTGNRVLASPDGASGIPGFRALTSNDLPDFDAAKVASGTIDPARLPAFSGAITTTAGSTVATIPNGTITDAKVSDVSWSKVTGKPTTVGGYGISDALPNGVLPSAVTIGTSNANPVSFKTANSSRMTILDSGYVGIGTTNPISHLHVVQPGWSSAIITSDTSNAELLLTGSSGSFYPGVGMRYFGGNLQFVSVSNGSANSNPWMDINGGSGTYNFTAITGSSVELKMSLRRGNSLSAVSSGTPLSRIAFDGYTSGAYSNSAAAIQGIAAENFNATMNGAHLAFYTTAIGTNTPSEKMRIHASGNVGIGTTSPGYKLHVVGTAGLSTGTAWTNASDARLKDVHGSFQKGLGEILKLQPVTYNYKKGNALDLPSNHLMTGFVAQDVQKVIPEAVTQREDGYLELNVDPIHWANINAVKELHGICADNSKKAAVLQAEKVQLEKQLKLIEAYLCSHDPNAPFCL